MNFTHLPDLDDLAASELLADGLYREVVIARGGPKGWLWGQASAAPGRLGVDTYFDLASLTKPCVATLALELDRDGVLPLSDPVLRHWPAKSSCVSLSAAPLSSSIPSPSAPNPSSMGSSTLTHANLGDLLSHRAGLRAWLPIYALAGPRPRDRKERENAVLSQLSLPEHWRESGRVYSDLGYMLWGVLAERALETDLTEIWASSRTARDAPGLRWLGPPQSASCRPSPIDTDKEVELGEALGIAISACGPPSGQTVQDGNARFLGPSGHAGLFGSLRAVAEWSRAWMPKQDARARLDRPEATLCWFRPALGGSCGRSVSALAFGHTGFVGGSVWFDPLQHRVALILGNRTSPQSDLTPARRRVNEKLLAPGAGC